MKLSFVIPTYNEAGNIAILLEKIKAVCERNHYNYKILIIDDNSPDHTAEKAKNFPNTLVTVRTTKRGLGSAYKDGFALIDSDTDLVVMIDADLSHDPDEIPNFVKIIKQKNYDVVQGSRKLKGGKIESWGASRYLISYVSSLITLPLLGIKDPNSSFKLFRYQCLKHININSLSNGFGLLIEILYEFRTMKCKITETPIVFHKRFKGESKLKMSEVFRSLKIYAKLFLRKILKIKSIKSQIQ